MRRLYETVDRLATSVIPVLLLGETGSGKEVLARALHERGPRRGKPLACINCGAIPATLIESVLFGHERGAFTGATGQARGLFEEADGGSILLDEVGELSPSAQAALLRVLETKQVRRVGASHDVPVDVRVIAATHRDLEAMTRTGAFRADLLYRLNAMILEIPPLRERPEEINPLVELFIAQANAANGREVRTIDDEARRVLHRYPWPGNLRELRNTIERAVVIAASPEITVADLPRKVRELAGAGRAAEPGPEAAGTLDLRAGVQRYEEQAILEALRQAGGNRTEAARRLGVPVRTLSHKIRQHGIRKLGFGVGDEVGEVGEGHDGDER
jgi:DNA-binding NtrC family response regulator